MLEGIKSLFRKWKTDKDPGLGGKITHLEDILGIAISEDILYLRALRHRSMIDDEKTADSESYERLEFLGDAVLDLIVSEIIYHQYPDKNEGFMTKLRAKIVKGDALAEYADHLNLGSVLEVGERAQSQGIEYSKSVLADVFESLIGALYLNEGYQQTSRFVEQIIQAHVDFDKLINTLDNFKSILLEYTQARQWEIPEYIVIEEYGPGHDKTFEIEVMVGDQPMGRGLGKSKKEAEQQAARSALDYLDYSNSDSSD